MKILSIILMRQMVVAWVCAALFSVSCSEKKKEYWVDTDEDEKEFPENSNAEKPRYIWIDAAANFPDFANSKENIRRDLEQAKAVGFTDVVVDVRPTTGDVLFKTTEVEQVSFLYAWVGGKYTRIERTASWDYLQAFVEEARKLKLRVHAAINTFVGGNQTEGGVGLLYRDASKAEWATRMNMKSGIMSVMDTGESTKFLNPAHPGVQTFLCALLKDLAAYDLDGILLDRGRFLNLQSDFSNETRRQFEAYLGGVKIQNFPADILPPGASTYPSTSPIYLDKWLEFRAKVIYDFMRKARAAVKEVNPKIKFGVYVGGWYSTYYDVGVNWAASTYDPSRYYRWATSRYKEYGYAALMDHILIGAYASPLKVFGTTEWTMEGFCAQAKDKIRGECPLVAGGPDVGNWDAANAATQEQENAAITQSVKACMDVCDGYFLFDMIHLKKANQWSYVAEGIQQAIKK